MIKRSIESTAIIKEFGQRIQTIKQSQEYKLKLSEPAKRLLRTISNHAENANIGCIIDLIETMHGKFVTEQHRGQWKDRYQWKDELVHGDTEKAANLLIDFIELAHPKPLQKSKSR